MRVGVVMHGFRWGGGIDLIRLITHGLVEATRNTPQHSVTVMLPVSGFSEVHPNQGRFAALTKAVSSSLRRNKSECPRTGNDFALAMAEAFAKDIPEGIDFAYHPESDRGLKQALIEAKIDVAIPINGTLGNDSPTPWVGYLPDFQHRYLPINFGPEKCCEREIGFLSVLRDAKSVIVNSNCAREDIARFYPWIDLSGVIALPFSPILPQDWTCDLKENVQELYQLPRRYFVISNQFWVHKDHPTAIRALKILRTRLDAALVCTGLSVDWRRPGYIEEIREVIRGLNLEGDVRLLGHIPKRHQVEIMKSAIAVVQPTLFEGGPGGGSVYDAVALGLPVILSDIPVNREVSGDQIRFFPPGDPEFLATAMEQVAIGPRIPPDYRALLRCARERANRLGAVLFRAIGQVTSS